MMLKVIEELDIFGLASDCSVGKTLVRIAPDQKIGVDFVEYNMFDSTCPETRL
jgi:hypothetical protein